MSELLRIARDVQDPDGTVRTETIVIPVETELADLLFRQKSGQGLDGMVTAETGITLVKHSDDRR
jgi:hypothetical protein